jgi:hypothetical protein
MAENNQAYRRYCYVCWYCGRCWRFALRGSFQSASNWAGVLGTGFLAFLLERQGRKIMPAETWFETVAQGLLYIVAAWLLIFVVRLLFVAPFQIRAEGERHGTKFIYREPKLAFHRYVTRSNNNVIQRFRFRDAPPFTLIDYTIEFSGNRHLVSICVAASPSQLPTFDDKSRLSYTKGSFPVGKNRDMFITTYLRAEADPFSIRVYVTGWDENTGPEKTEMPKHEPPPISPFAAAVLYS